MLIGVTDRRVVIIGRRRTPDASWIVRAADATRCAATVERRGTVPFDGGQLELDLDDDALTPAVGPGGRRPTRRRRRRTPADGEISAEWERPGEEAGRAVRSPGEGAAERRAQPRRLRSSAVTAPPSA